MVDLVRIKVKAGSGGDGTVSWHHEKFKPKGGPDGGNGGNGGSIYIVADPQLWSLSDLKSQTLYKAGDGKRGGKNNCTGKSAEDLVIRVPVGTVVKTDSRTQKRVTKTENRREKSVFPFLPSFPPSVISPPTSPIADLIEPGQRVLVAQGGTGGRGNATFKSSTHQRPTEWTAGTPGEEKNLTLELKILADVGLIGLPSSGKSSLLNALTGARAAVGAYPFTTLEPNLGVLRFPRISLTDLHGSSVKIRTRIRENPVVIADLPGLIEGASRGRGLGEQFLKHVERCKVLVHLVSAENIEKWDDRTRKVVMKTESGRENSALSFPSSFPSSVISPPTSAYQTIRSELAAWSPELAQKPEIVVISKADLLENREQRTDNRLFISTKTGEGLEELVAEIKKVLEKEGEKGEAGTEGTEVAPESKTVGKTFTIGNLPNKRIVFSGSPGRGARG